MDTKRVKRLIYAKAHKALVLSEPGLGLVTRREVEGLTRDPLQPLEDSPQLRHTDDGIEVSCLSFRRLLELGQRLQTAPDIFWVLGEKRVASPSELFKALDALSWELFLTPESAVHVSADSRGSRLYHEGLIRETTESFLEGRGYRPEREKGMRLKLLLRENRLIIMLGLFEEPLFKRGNKSALRATAPLRETLAAGLIYQTVAWLREHGPFHPNNVYVPFAGSGTLGLEMLAFNGGFSWQAFFQGSGLAETPCFPKSSMDFIARRLRERASAASPLSVCFVDHHEEMVEVLEGTMAKAAPYLALDTFVSCEAGDFFSRPVPDPALILLHPPYGDRLGLGDVEGFYGRIAAKLREAPRSSGFILIPEEGAWVAFLRNLGGFAYETSHVTQGGKDIRVVRFRPRA